MTGSNATNTTSQTARSFYAHKLFSLNWYQKTSKKVKDIVENLPEKYDTFLRHLSTREEVVGNFEILTLDDLKISDEYIILTFKIRSLQTNEVFNREYIYKVVQNELESKGVILIETNGTISHIVIQKIFVFPLGVDDYSAINVYYPTFSNEKIISLPAKIESQIKIILNEKTIKIKRFLDLGIINTDSQTTNRNIPIFAAVIGIEKDLSKEVFRVDKMEVLPISNLWNIANKCNDSILLSILCRIKSLDIVNKI